MDNCSVFRDQKLLEDAKSKIRELFGRYNEVGLSVRQRRFNMELMEAVECDHLLNLSAVIVESALNRKESRGAYFREDYPDRDDTNYLVHSLAFKDGEKIRIETKPVNITRFEPVERKY